MGKSRPTHRCIGFLGSALLLCHRMDSHIVIVHSILSTPTTDETKAHGLTQLGQHM